ncbi:cytochrome transmembrane ATP-binding ABC transporter CydD domain protein [Mycobacterium xenopi 4042]|uniref:Cytochrome transmembrane ATP-binding ABC transporter CydD domain protein n=1 Tax=Mycobacterium xenopi 4042 TaxID=1299334 RepID=X7YQP5_MYCXE|nr:cytochrome transmembrane ATP-binding ABC transporter CydD domain protein [Mycobacterium xenopi 4042]
MAVDDLKSAAIALVTLPLIPVFMVLIGVATAQRSAAALAAMTTLQAKLLDLIAGIPTLRALGRAAGRNNASPNWLPHTDVRLWRRCASRSCQHWCSNCWPRWASR